MMRKTGCDEGRRNVLRALAGVPLLPGVLAAACKKGEGERRVVELSGDGAAAPAATPETAAAVAGATEAVPAASGLPWAGKFPEYDLAGRVGFAALRREGLWIDFGTTDAAKYTLGGWRTGWGRMHERDGVRYAHAVTSTARVFFPWETAEELVVRMRVKRFGATYGSSYLNDKDIIRVDLPSDDWDVRTFRLPADRVIAGENQLMFRWSGTREVAGEELAAAFDWIHIAPAARAEAAAAEPLTQAEVRGLPPAEGGGPRVLVPAGGGLSFPIEVPAGPSVVGLVVAAAGAGAATLTVRAAADGAAPGDLAREQVAAGDAPRPVAIDLTPLAGKVIRLDLDAAGGGVALSGSGVFRDPRPGDPATLARLGRAKAKNVILVMIDTLRADHTPPYGPTRVQAPVLGLVAERGALFERFSAVEDWTKPSCATMLTGLYPNTHKAQTDDGKLSASVRMVSEDLQQAGLATAAFIANGYVSDKFGFKRGWDHYVNFIRESKPTNADNVFGRALEWIEQHKERPFYAYVHTIDPHVPYSPPEEFLRLYDDRPYDGPIDARKTHLQIEQIKKKTMQVTDRDKQRVVALYDGEISYHDGHMGSFLKRLDELGLLEDTLVVVTSDHGEEFWERDSVGHGHSIFQELIHVPFALMWKGFVPGGRRVADNHDHTVIVPTIFEALGLPPPDYCEGRSVLAKALGREELGPHAGFSTHQGDRMAVWSGRHKFQLSGPVRGALFDLEEDPGCKTDRDDERPIVVRYMRTLLGAFMGAPDKRYWRHPDLSRANVGDITAEQAAIDPELDRQLEALGYLRP
ncbi:MAG: sulfatase [Deltaproteobacteria bacterium]|nr:sulfatase [Deltaproteobacteria bacterium]